MADDDEVVTEGFDENEGEEDDVADLEPGELDEDELDEEGLVVDEEFEVDDDFVAAEEEEEEEEDATGPVRRTVAEDEDEDEELLAPDDVEADLDTILKDRLVAAEDEEDEEEEPEQPGEAPDRLQPKRADEQLCPRCFLLVRQSAPLCPVGDDECPFFPR